MKLQRSIAPLAIAMLLLLGACNDLQEEQKSRYTYETVEGDPLGAMIHTLDNGLKVYLSVNKEEPRIVTQIAVRTGSKQDPSDATGLAHYLEHMLFKGTSRVGTKDWEAEKVVLQQISDLYEVNRSTTDPEERKKIYSKIDSLSTLASALAISNEYDKMVSSLGARGTNAYTSNEQTVYINDIPANELEKWLALESERFRELVLRLFHTELEVVYEEFNRGQDSDFRLAYYTMMEGLFPTHQYGTQTTIGTSEHLKNPSMVKIHEYFKKHYIPNNMAIVLSGDLDPDETIDLIKEYFGDWKPGELPTFEVAQEAAIESPIVKDVQGVQAEMLMIGYRLPGIASDEALLGMLVDGILSNGQAGLIDINLQQKQKVLSAYSSMMPMSDYSVFMLQGSPRQGQSLDELGALLRGELDRVKAGDFPDWMIEAVINDLKLSELRGSENNWARAGQMVDAFVTNMDWKEVVNAYDRMAAYTKEDVVAFANKYFGDNYVQVNKHSGESMAVKVEKPIITPVEIDREAKSPFYAQWDSIETGRAQAAISGLQRTHQYQRPGQWH
jgi:zinc protease